MKIAISGAGIAGPTLAYWLLQLGHEPTLIEKAPAFRAGGYLIDFWGIGHQVAERMGILPEIEAFGYKIDQMRFVDRCGKTRSSFPGEVFRQTTGGRFISVPRGELAKAIYGTIEGKAETLFGTSIAAFAEDPEGVALQLGNGQNRRFDLLVGADGLHSRVRSLAFGPSDRFEEALGFRVAAFEATDYEPRELGVYVSYTTQGRHVARFALSGSKTLFLIVYSNRWHPSLREGNGSLKSTLATVLSDAGWESPLIIEALERAEHLYFDTVDQVRMSRWSKGRVILIGDAASCPSLLAGEGAGLAMAQAYALAGELKRADRDHQTAFRRYERRLRPFLEDKQRWARRFAPTFAPKTPLGVWARCQATKLIAFPPLTKPLVRYSLQDKLDLPDYKL